MGLIDAVMQPVRPLIFIVAGLMFGFVSTAELLLAMDFSTLLSPSAFRKYWFARLWRFIGPLSYAMGKDNVAPLVAQAKGRVLDIGTGTGHFLRYYDKEQVTKIYAVETNRGQHVGLLQAAQEAGLSDRLEALDQPLELLRDHSDLQHGTIDTIVTIQVLCSVDDQDRLIKELYNYLKPGGQWIVYEHVKTSSKGVLGSILARYQGKQISDPTNSGG